MKKRFIEFNGFRYYPTTRSNYYYRDDKDEKGIRRKKALHREIWEFYSGEKIPDGYEIHHIDNNPENNEFSNLMVIDSFSHKSYTFTESWKKDEYRTKIVAHLSNIRWLAEEARKSDDVKSRTSISLKKAWSDGKYKKIERICKHCGKIFETIESKPGEFCNRNCWQNYRYKMRVDFTLEKECEWCGKIFISHKNKKTRFCSKSCARKFNRNPRVELIN